MDREQARHTLEDAAALGAGLRGRARSHGLLWFGVGGYEVAILLIFGLAVAPPANFAIMPFGIMPMIALSISAASQRVVPRHHRTLYGTCGAIGAAIFAVVVPLGSSTFTGNAAWWVPGAVATALPFFVVGLVGLRAASRRP